MGEFEIGREIEKLNQRITKLETMFRSLEQDNLGEGVYHVERMATVDAFNGGGGGVTAADLGRIADAARPK